MAIDDIVERPAKLHLSRIRDRCGLTAVVQSMIFKVGIIGLNAATGILTARVLAPAGRGELAAIILWPFFLCFAGTFGLPTALSYHIKKNDRHRSALLGAGLLVGLVMSALVGVAAAMAMPVLLVNYSQSVIAVTRLLLIIIPASMLMYIAKGVFEATGHFSTSITADLLVPSLTLLTLVILTVLHRLTPFAAACAYALAYIPIAIWLFYKMARFIQPTLSHLSKNVRVLLAYGFSSYGIDLCGTLAIYVDQAFVVNLLNSSALGIYVVALSASRMLNICQASVVMVLLPKAVGMDIDQIVAVTGRAARASLCLTAAMATTLWVLAPIIIRLLYGVHFNESVPILRVLLIEVTIAGAVWVLAQPAMAVGRPGVIASLQLVGLLVTIPLMWLFIPRYGAAGAALALLMSTSARFILILFAFRFVLRTNVPRIWIKPSDLREFGGLLADISLSITRRVILVKGQ